MTLSWTRGRFGAVLVALVTLPGVALAAEERLPIPKNIETRNVPALSPALGQRLQRYSNARGAGLYGWQGDELLIGTRFGETSQLHRVSQPLGYREQLTFLSEPLGGVYLPRRGATDTAIISWDVGGSEFDQLFRFDLKTGDAELISDGKSLYRSVLWSPDEKRIAYVTTERNGRNWDTHIRAMDGTVNKVFETESGYWYPIAFSPDGRKLLMKHRVSINVSSIHELDLATRELTRVLGEDGESAVLTADYDGRGGLYFIGDAGAEFHRLQHLNLATGEVQVLTEDLPWNVEGMALSPDRDRLAFSVNENGFSRLEVLRLPSHRPLKLPELPRGVLTSLDFSPDGKRLALSLNRTTAPTDVYVMDLRGRSLTRWTQSEVGGLDTSTFVEAQPFRYTSFDGRSIPAFLFEPDTPGPHPVVILIHGGPEAQYRPRFSTVVQSWVTEMGVAVIAPNVRGSSGYGKTYLKLDNGMLREDSDIGALLDWVDGQKNLLSNRVAVYGGSYGGYMVLASMVHFGDRLTAAVESVGISSFVTFLENTQPYRQDIRRVEYGDERDPAMRAHLEKISPLNHVDRMKTPLLISQGANDPRVPASESEQIYQALTDTAVPVWYILARDEGHGFRKKANRDYDRAAKFAFLESFLKAE